MERNHLYPIFLKTHQLHILIVGGGFVALEKISFLLKSSPDANVTLVAPFFREETKEFAAMHHIQIIDDTYKKSYLKNKQIELFGDATLDYMEIKLTANYMLIDLNKKEVFASYTFDADSNRIGMPVFTDGAETVDAASMRFNF